MCFVVCLNNLKVTDQFFNTGWNVGVKLTAENYFLCKRCSFRHVTTQDNVLCNYSIRNQAT